MKNKLFFSAMLLLAFGLTLSSCAPSAAKQAIMSAASVEEVTGLRNKLTWLESNAESGETYIIEVDSDEIIDKTDGFSEFLTVPFSHKGNLSYKNRSDITITLRGIGANRTISSSYNDGTTIFTVGSGITLVLDNIKIQTGSVPSMRLQSKGGALIEIYDGGTLVMNKGSTITGAVYSGNEVPDTTGKYASINSGGGVHVDGGTFVMNDGSAIIFNTNKFSNGGGVHVSSGGTFIMKGGTIAGNSCFPIPVPYSDNREVRYKGGGVYVSGKATFTKSGGTIIGNPGNQVRDFEGNNVTQNSGHAVYFDGSKGKEAKSIDTTVGPEMNFHFSNGKFNENWNE